MYPAPPRICTAFSVTATATSPALSLLIEPSPASNGRLLRPIQAARHTSSRAASISMRMSASANATPWLSMIGRPNWTRLFAYSSAYSYAARAMPSAWAPTVGRDSSNVRIAAWPLDFWPDLARAIRSSRTSLPPSRQRPGTRTSSRNTSAVCDARSPSLRSFLVAMSPGVPGGDVGTGLRLGGAERRHLGVGHVAEALRHPLEHLLRRAGAVDRGDRQSGAEEGHADAAVAPEELLIGDAQAQPGRVAPGV